MAKIDKSQRPSLAKNISKRRKELGMSQSDLADGVGVHRNTIADIERGVSEGQPDTRAAIAKVLECSVAELFGGQRQSVTDLTYARAISLLSAYESAPQHIREIVDQALSLDETEADSIASQ